MRICRRTWFFLLNLFWIAGHTAVAEEPSAWPEFSPPQGGFSIRLPSVPTEQVNSSTGVINYQVIDGDRSYVVSIVTVPPEILKMPPQQILDLFKSGYLRSIPDSRMLSSENLKVDGFPATTYILEAQWPGKPDAKLKMMAVFAGSRFFNVGFMSLKSVFVEAEVDKYLATFKIK